MSDIHRITELLGICGLDIKESAIYLSLTKTPAQTALQLSESTGIPRSSVYRILQSAIQKGVINTTQQIDGKESENYTAIPTTDLYHLVETKVQEANQIEQALGILETELLAAQPTQQLPGIGHSGQKQFRQVLNACLMESEQLQLLVSHTYALDDLLSHKLIKLAEENSYAIKVLYSGTESLLTNSKAVEVRNPGIAIEGITVIGSTGGFFFIHPITTIRGLEVSSPLYSKTMRSIFDSLWQKSMLS